MSDLIRKIQNAQVDVQKDITAKTVGSIYIVDGKRTHLIHQASKHGHLLAVQRCLDLQTRTSLFPDEDNYRTPLHHAAAQGHYEVVKLLAKHHNSETHDKLGKTPLESAIQHGHQDVAELLQRLRQ